MRPLPGRPASTGSGCGLSQRCPGLHRTRGGTAEPGVGHKLQDNREPDQRDPKAARSWAPGSEQQPGVGVALPQASVSPSQGPALRSHQTGAAARLGAEVRVSTVRTPRAREAARPGKGPVGVASVLRAASLHPALGHAGTARHLLSPPRPSPRQAPEGFPSPDRGGEREQKPSLCLPSLPPPFLPLAQKAQGREEAQEQKWPLPLCQHCKHPPLPRPAGRTAGPPF